MTQKWDKTTKNHQKSPKMDSNGLKIIKIKPNLPKNYKKWPKIDQTWIKIHKNG
jgi:hypothetical protein